MAPVRSASRRFFVKSVDEPHNGDNHHRGMSAARLPCRRMLNGMDRLERNPMRRLRGALLVVVTLAVLGAGLFPGCAGDACCARPAAPAVHAQMPCCEQPALERRDAPQRVAVSIAQDSTKPAPRIVASVVATDPTPLPPRVKAALATILAHPADSSAPRFLLHAQFLI